jgi:AmiR/NasT family two-component response regulator
VLTLFAITAGEVSFMATVEGRAPELEATRLEIAELQAEVAVAAARIANLESALLTNRVIGMAVGILVERRRLTADEAFARLVRLSQRTHRRVSELADELVYTGELPAA